MKNNYQYTGYITPNNPTGLPVKQTKNPALIAILSGTGTLVACFVITILFFVFLFGFIFSLTGKNTEYEKKYPFIRNAAREQMEKHNIDPIKDHEVADYAKINEIYDDYVSKGDYTIFLGYCWVMGDKETEKVIQANGYENWADFLYSQGFDRNNSSNNVFRWKLKMYDELDKRHSDKAVEPETESPKKYDFYIEY